MPPKIDQTSGQNVQDSFNNSTGSSGLANLYQKGKDALTQAIANKQKKISADNGIDTDTSTEISGR